VQLLHCSLPSEIDPVKWKILLEIPIANDQYYLKDQLPGDFEGGFKINFGKKQNGDTIFISKSDSIEVNIEQQLISLDTTSIEQILGEQEIQNSPSIDLLFDFTQFDIPLPPNIEIPESVSFIQSQDADLGGIKSVSIDESSPPISFEITNKSGIALTDLFFSLLNFNDTLGTFRIPLLSGNSSIQTLLALGGKKISNPLTVSISSTIPAGSTISIGSGIQVQFNLDGQLISEAEIADSMISYEDFFEGNLDLADSIKIDLVDIEDARIYCSIQNPCALKMFISGSIDNAWQREFSESRNITSVKQLTTIKDSSKFAGKILSDTIFHSPLITDYSNTISLDNIRFFPTWIPDSGKSVLGFRFRVKSIPDGRTIRFNKNGVIRFNLVPSKFPFVHIKGLLSMDLLNHFLIVRSLDLAGINPYLIL